MDNGQFLLSKVIDFGNLLSALAAKVDRNAEDIRRIGDFLKPLNDKVTDTGGRLEALETYREETQDEAKTLLLTKPNRTSNIIAIIALCISTIVGAATMYFLLHPVH